MKRTLGFYLGICKALFGEDSPATEFVRFKIEESPHGEEEEVIADEEQMMILLESLAVKEPTEIKAEKPRSNS